MPKPLDLPSDVEKKDGKWIRICPKCQAEVRHLRRNYCVHSSLTKQPCKKCSNKNNHPSGMVGHVRLAWFNSFYKSAITRGYVWEITPEFVNDLYISQGGVCELTGIPIEWASEGWGHTASIDRIDNSVGYTEDNIQLVHKDVNMMRGSLDIDRFQELCCLVADRVKW